MKQLTSLDAKGIVVERNYYAYQQPFITHGVVALTNAGEASMTVTIARVQCLAGDDVIPIDDFFVYLLPNYDETHPGRLELLPGATNQYEISFPRISAVPYLMEEIQIEVELGFEGQSIKVRSPYQISRRTPRR